MPCALGASLQRGMAVVEGLGELDQLLVVPREAGVDQQRDRRGPHAGGVQHLADDVEVPAQHVVVVGLGLLDRLDRPGGDPVG